VGAERQEIDDERNRDVLRYAGVGRVYGVIEDGLKPIAEAIAGIDGMAWVEVRNEQAAALSVADEA
jgi:pyruvate dehydrogenase (quinone)